MKSMDLAAKILENEVLLEGDEWAKKRQGREIQG
jgi:hypothetical protein